MKLIASLFGLFLLSGCVIPPPKGDVSSPREYNFVSEHEITDNSIRSSIDGYDSPLFLSCLSNNTKLPKYTGNPAIAEETYQFALMASNSYRSEPQFKIPGWSLVTHYRGALSGEYESSLQADLYEKSENGNIAAVALVFRGTDESLDKKANFALWWPWSNSREPAQYQIAEELAKKIRHNYPQAKLYFVGHSLGAALAYHASWDQRDASTYAFDPSPRLWVEGESAQGRRVIVREDGEILEYLQFWSFLPADADEQFDFIRGNVVREHNMYYLARGLLLLAAINNDKTAIDTMENNLGCSHYAKQSL